MNIRSVSAETASWVLQQFRAVQDLPLPDLSGRTAEWATHTKTDAVPIEQHRAMSSKAAMILAEVARATGVPASVIQFHTQSKKATAARYEFWARCRREIQINGKPVSFAWIASQSGFDSSSVQRGVAIYEGALEVCK